MNLDLVSYGHMVDEYVSKNGTDLWKTVICLAYDADPMGVKALKTAEKKLEKILARIPNLHNPKVFAIAMSPREIIDKMEDERLIREPTAQPLLTSQRKLIISHLKDSEQMIQVGAGQGRATIIVMRPNMPMDKNHLLIPIDEPEKLFEALQHAVFGAQSDLAEMRAIVAEKTAEVDALRTQVDNLQSEVYIYSASTWS